MGRGGELSSYFLSLGLLTSVSSYTGGKKGIYLGPCQNGSASSSLGLLCWFHLSVPQSTCDVFLSHLLSIRTVVSFLPEWYSEL